MSLLRHLPLVVIGLALAGGAHAQNLAQSVNKAEAALAELQSRLTTLENRQKAEISSAFRAQIALLQLANWPEGLTTTGALLSGGPLPGGLIGATGRHTTAELEDLAAQLQTYTGLQSRAAEQLAALNQLRTAYAGHTRRLSQLERTALAEAETEAEGLAATLTAALKSPQAPLPEVAAPAPSRLPVPGRVLYGFHQGGADTTQTEGLTFAAPAQSAVTALSTGQVLYAGPFRNLGGLVIIKTGRLHYVYAGMAEVQTSPGSTVREGATIGKLADENPARLYLEIRRSGRPIDPARVLSAR